MRVRDVMTRLPLCCTPDTAITDAAYLMAERDCGAIPVVGVRVTGEIAYSVW